jgi:hypothetical protein
MKFVNANIAIYTVCYPNSPPRGAAIKLRSANSAFTSYTLSSHTIFTVDYWP